MKKTLIALAALAATAAFAQSTVTLYGGADLSYRSVTSGDNKFTGMAQDGMYSSRVGIRGTEDLGGGMKANFHFEGGMNPDTGTPGGFNFTRHSTIGISSAMGEVRLGRDLTPAFTVNLIADPFGVNGIGTSLNLSSVTVFAEQGLGAQDAVDNTGTFTTAARDGTIANERSAAGYTDGRITAADPSFVRANNSVAYYSPNFSGFSASAMYSFGAENTFSLKPVGKVTSVKLAYAQGPVSVAFANQVTKGGFAAAAAVTSGSNQTIAVDGTDDQKWTTNVLAASYDLKVVKLGYMNRSDKYSIADESAKIRTQLFGVSAPLGAFTLKASYVIKKAEGEKAGKQVAIGGTYDLSKRTAVYATYSRLTNEEGFANSIGSAATSEGGMASKGFETGIRHTF